MDGLLCTHLAYRAVARSFLAIVMLVIGVLCAGCSQLIDPKVPAPLRDMVEPKLGRDYLLYCPSHYDRQYDWPLIVVCHTSFPDSPNRRIRQWTEAAESYGFLVAAPKLKGTRRFRPPKAKKQIARQREDEEAILSMVRHIQAGHNVSDDRIFIHGWSGGAYAALYTGLRHADIFRAVSLMHPKFKEGFLGDTGRYISPHQPIEVIYSLSEEISGKHASRCLRWLRTQAANVHPNPGGGLGVKGMKRPLEFFEKVVRKHPWIHIRALTAEADPLEIRFKLRISLKPTRYRWDFGDGTTSDAAEPVHSYPEAGTYLVAVTVGNDESGEHRRAIRLSLPSGTVEVMSANSKASP